jgi:hypothetical protein
MKVQAPSRQHAIAAGIQAYQDYTLMINDEPSRRLDDEQLLADWTRQFPDAKGCVFVGELAERLAIVRSIRRDYNKGVQNHGHRNAFGSLEGPARHLSLPYRDGQMYVYSERWLRACEGGTRNRVTNDASPVARGRATGHLAKPLGATASGR